jgi:hypothetical protein
VVRNRVADLWHSVAAVAVVAVSAVWALNVKNGYALLLQYFIGTAAVLMLGRLISVVVLGRWTECFASIPSSCDDFPAWRHAPIAICRCCVAPYPASAGS